jgi:DNA-binding MarR family transcriptional regulator
MKKIETEEDIKVRQELAHYIEKVRKYPRVRSLFWLLRCADAVDKYAGMEVGMHGDSRIGIAVLQILLKHPSGVSQQSIARQTGRTKQTINVAINNLEKKNYVIRFSDSSDRRTNSIRITKEGIDHLSEVFPHTVEWCGVALSTLNDTEIEQFLSIVIKVSKKVWQEIESKSTKNV